MDAERRKGQRTDFVLQAARDGHPGQRAACPTSAQAYDLSYGEYCCLQALARADGGQAGSEGLAGLLMLERTTVRKILLGLSRIVGACGRWPRRGMDAR